MTSRAAAATAAALLILACGDETDPSPLEFAALTAGGRSACALTLEGELFCWGDNGAGQLVLQQNPVLVPTPLDDESEFESISLGQGSCGIAAGRAFCWGAGALFGNLGIGSLRNEPLPQAVRGGHDFRSVSAGDQASCGIDTDGAAWCWGRATDGLLGVGDVTAPTDGIAQCGAHFSGEFCALEPVRVASDETFAAISVGEWRACATTTGGDAFCWGYDLLGNGVFEGSRVPVRVTGDHEFATVATADDELTCGLTLTGKAFCWGVVVGSEPGDGGPVLFSEEAPVEVGPSLTFTELAVGDRHACGVTPGGTAWCWGANSTGALGDGTTDHAMTDGALVPVVAGSGIQFRTIAAGADFTCARAFDGALYCWGANHLGQLGNGTLSASLTPTLVSAP
jgi:alpha-tubulin suppressor-like RCC1 family protein